MTVKKTKRELTSLTPEEDMLFERYRRILSAGLRHPDHERAFFSRHASQSTSLTGRRLVDLCRQIDSLHTNTFPRADEKRAIPGLVFSYTQLALVIPYKNLCEILDVLKARPVRLKGFGLLYTDGVTTWRTYTPPPLVGANAALPVKYTRDQVRAAKECLVTRRTDNPYSPRLHARDIIGILHIQAAIRTAGRLTPDFLPSLSPLLHNLHDSFVPIIRDLNPHHNYQLEPYFVDTYEPEPLDSVLPPIKRNYQRKGPTSQTNPPVPYVPLPTMAEIKAAHHLRLQQLRDRTLRAILPTSNPDDERTRSEERYERKQAKLQRQKERKLQQLRDRKAKALDNLS